jgi:beta-mannosidase
MGTEYIDLNGTWQLWDISPGEKIASPEQLDENPLAAKVPGNVELDLMRAGKLPDLFHGLNIYAAQKLESHDWWYRRTFTVFPLEESHRAELVFEGIDCIAHIWINGKKVADLDNMFIAHRVPFDPQPGENEVVVHIESAVNTARRYRYEPALYAMAFNMESLYIRKAAHMYGWDIMPRIVSAGLWRDVRVELRAPSEIVEIYYAIAHTNEHSSNVRVAWEIATDRPNFDNLFLRFRGRCGDSAFEHTVPARFTAGQTVITISEPSLWWPRGYGDPALYDVTCDLLHGDEVIDSRVDRIGLRCIDLSRENGDFLFRVNGTPILVKGANWVPADAFHSRDAARYADNLALFADLSCNMLRCWGGNVYEDHAFFDFCDETGIMVWQDFALGCAAYPQDAGFRERIRIEAEAIIRKLRNHPSLALWCGNNENDSVGYAPRGIDPAHDLISRQTLAETAHRCDPYRPYVPSSPYYLPGVPVDELPERHLWGPRDYYKSDFYTQNRARFIGEIGYHGCPNVESIRRFIDDDFLWPWQDNDQWRAHASDPDPAGGPYAYRIELMANQIAEVFGEQPHNLEDFALASQIVQAEAKKFFIEMMRLGKWHRTGILWWNVIDGWPQFSDAIVDYYYGKKLAYTYIKRVQQPVCLMMREPKNWHLTAVMGNDSRREAAGTFTIRDADSGETVLSGSYHVSPNQNAELGKIRVSRGAQKMFLMEWTEQSVKGGVNHYLHGSPPFSYEQYRTWLKQIQALSSA